MWPNNAIEIRDCKPKETTPPRTSSNICKRGSPWRNNSQLSVLQKFNNFIKMGQGSSSNHHGGSLRGSPGRTPPSNYDLPPLKFHSTHGDNIHLSTEGYKAHRHESFCKGVLFSNRPVMVGEGVCLRMTELSSRWSGVIRVGFSSHDPALLAGRLPKYACPDLTSKSGYWAKALSERCVETDAVIHYYVSAHGDVHFGINGGDLGVFFSGVDTRQPLWAMVDLYGNCTAIEFIDTRRNMNNYSGSHTPSLQVLSPPAYSNVVALPPPQQMNQRIQPIQQQFPPPPPPPPPSTSSSSLRQASSATSPEPKSLRYNGGIPFRSMTFHRNVGKNVQLDTSNKLAGRLAEEFAQGYVFSCNPVVPGQRMVVQVLSTEESYIGSLAFGLTSCDPDSLEVNQLPEDSDLLLDRPEYWVVSKDVANSPSVGDELSFTLNHDGSVEFAKNNGIPSVFMHVDITLPLWAFWDVYGHTSRIKLWGSTEQNLPRPESQSVLPPVEAAQEALLDTSTNSQPSECTVCYEKPVDCVLYTCGHMCMCYECALQQWKGRGGGFCPMCRLTIRDVIKTFRS